MASVTAKKIKDGYAVIEKSTSEVLLTGYTTMGEAGKRAKAVTERLNEGDTLEEAVTTVLNADEAKTDAIEKLTEIENENGASDAELERHACLCGCGGEPGKSSRFMPGHDGRLKGRLIATWRTGDATERADAAARMNELGWGNHLIETKEQRARAERRVALMAKLRSLGYAEDDSEIVGKHNADLLRLVARTEAIMRRQAEAAAKLPSATPKG